MTFDEKFKEILRLLTEAYMHYFEHSDGYCKSSEGAISLHWPSYFWNEARSEPSVEIYSYVLGPSRTHYFKDVDEALATVRQWHHNEMHFDHEAAEAEMEAAMRGLE